jgi:ABC-type lipoprotein release transport system permease subunit
VIGITLFKVAPLDRSVFLIATPVLTLVSLTAALVPALRAANVEPVRSLRCSRQAAKKAGRVSLG